MNQSRLPRQAEPYRVPRSALPEISPAGFMLFALCGLPEVLLWQVATQAVYQRAFAEAQAVVRPSLPERDLLGVWN
jgi:hypothetical protein